jgi:chromosome segregation ATPase
MDCRRGSDRPKRFDGVPHGSGAATIGGCPNRTRKLQDGGREGEELQVKLEQATSALKSTESLLAETQSRLDGAQNDLAGTKQLSDQIKVQVDSLERKAANLTSELRKADGQRIELQLKLDEAKAEIAKLKRERFERAPN